MKQKMILKNVCNSATPESKEKKADFEGAMTVSIMTLSITTFSIKGLFVALFINDT
jgi:hypothetical protein